MVKMQLDGIDSTAKAFGQVIMIDVSSFCTTVYSQSQQQHYIWIIPQKVFLSTHLFFRLKQYLFPSQWTCEPSSSALV